MNLDTTLRIHHGTEPEAAAERRPWWDHLILLVALGVFVWAAAAVQIPRVALSIPWVVALTVILLAVLAVCAGLLWKRTRFA